MVDDFFVFSIFLVFSICQNDVAWKAYGSDVAWKAYGSCRLRLRHDLYVRSFDSLYHKKVEMTWLS